ncbi:MAG: hypothetical protein EBV06_10700 [Planctomycetia bacterium]|nr:hypothetical protein [Planctomycetia bacterium]
MFRLAVCVAVLIAASVNAQVPYPASSGPIRPEPVGSGPARGAAGGVLDVKPSTERLPTVEVNQTITQIPSYTGGIGGYSLGTMSGYNPYMYNPPWGTRQTALNGYLTGVASVTTATGEYWNQIGQAQLTREQARRSSYDTARKRIETEMWYESLKPKTQDLIDAAVREDLERARRDPPATEIWSGKSLNALLNNILKCPQPTNGPTIPLTDDMLRGLNLVDKSSRGNLSMAKDEGKIAWPEALQEEVFDGPRDRFSKLFSQAISSVNAGAMPDFKVIRELRKELKDMETQLDDQVDKISTGSYLAGRRTLNQLKTQVAGLSDPAVVKSSRSWRNEVRTVGDLVRICQTLGMEFGASASPGDERAYTATYYSLRNYERDLVQLARR